MGYVYFKLPILGAVYAELDPPGPLGRGPWAAAWVENGANHLMVGRLRVIHDPPNWRERRDAATK